MNKIEDIKDKLITFAENEIIYAEKDGSSRFATCSNSNWDQDIWNHKHAIMDYIRTRGYSVRTETNHGVLDVFITKPIKL